MEPDGAEPVALDAEDGEAVGENPGMDRWAATRSTSSVLSASASARPASSRKASRDRRRSAGAAGAAPVGRVPVPAPAIACTAGASCSVPTISSGRPAAEGSPKVRITTVRTTRPSSRTTRSNDSEEVPSAIARATAADMST